MFLEFANYPLNVIAALWLLSAFFDYSEFGYIWQLKEYRFDQLKDYFRTKQGQAFRRGYRLLWRSIIVLSTYIFLRDAFVALPRVIILLLTIDLGYNAYNVIKRRVRHPDFTPKALILIFLSFIIEAGILFVIHGIHMIVYFMIIRFITFTLAVIIMSLPTTMIKKRTVRKATQKLADHKDLVVIGITGSYGKSTVKTFLASILSHDGEVIYAPKNINTEIGIARYILNTNLTHKKYFVVEMGAYRKGEIAIIANMVKPSIGILTAIAEQHLTLFGSIRNIQQAKYELVRAIPSTGLAVMNGDNRYVRELAHELVAPVQYYGCDDEQDQYAMLTEIKFKAGTLRFTAQIEGEDWQIEAPVVGEHNASNITACILAARQLGINKTTIIDACKQLSLPDRTLATYEFGNATIIDDSYNASIDGFKAALDVLAKYPSSKRRVVITRGVQELGAMSGELHERLGGEIAYCADELVIITPDHAESLVRGVGEKYHTTVMHLYEFAALEEYLMSLKEQDVVILIENRIPPYLYKKIKADKQSYVV